MQSLHAIVVFLVMNPGRIFLKFFKSIKLQNTVFIILNQLADTMLVVGNRTTIRTNDSLLFDGDYFLAAVTTNVK